MLVLLGSAANAFAAKPVDRSDKVPHRYPLVAALCSIVPGGGQLYTQKYYRAAAFAGTLGYLGYRYYREDRAMNRELAALPLTLADSLYHSTQYDQHYQARRSAFWWGFGVWLFSLADAYVDAHMFKFDDRAEPRIVLRAAPAGLALSAKF